MKNIIRVAVTGASGLLGRPLMDLLTRDSRYEVSGAALSRAGGPVSRVDLTRSDEVENWLNLTGPDVLIHLAAERRPDVYESDPAAADRLNIGAAEALAAKCAAREVSILFLSTNYVFDGTSPPYLPWDQPNPLNAYGRGKLAGERAVTAAHTRNRVLRVPMLHGPSEYPEESSVTILALPFLDGSGPVRLDVRQTRYPVFTPDLAAAIAGLIPGLAEGSLPGPVLHFCPDEGFTKRDMGEIIAAHLGADPSRAVPDDRPPSGPPRPENTRLSCPHMADMGLLRFTPFRRAVGMSLDSIRAAGGFGRK
jgi:dTDP-4-dehydrorhamnose reductase